MKRMIVLLAAIASMAVGCQTSSELKGENCIILANGGNKLCGAEAKAWCESTANLREGSGAEQDDSLRKSREACASVE